MSIASIAAAGWLLAAAPVPASDASTQESLAPVVEAPDRTWTVGAFVDTAYLFNSNLPDNHLYRGAFTTPRTGEFTIGLAAAYLDHGPTDDEPWSFQLALQAGASADALYEPEPIPGGADGRLAGADVFKHIGLANAGFRIRRTGTRIDGGLMTSPLGIGGFWSKDNWNYSPSWAANAAPYYLAGGRVVQPFGRGFGAHAWIVNGWQTIADTNAAPSYLAGLHYEGEEVTVYSQAYFGPDDVELGARYWRLHLDNWVIWDRGRWGLGAVLDGGRERVAGPVDDDVVYWLGTAAFARVEVVRRRGVGLDLSTRPDMFWDKDGRMFGVPQALIAGTGTASVDLFGYVLARLEYRYDHSTAYAGFFYRGDATSDTARLAGDQHTIFASLVGHIEHAFALGQRRRSGT